MLRLRTMEGLTLQAEDGETERCLQARVVRGWGGRLMGGAAIGKWRESQVSGGFEVSGGSQVSGWSQVSG